MPALRTDPVTGRRVVIAPDRANRPQEAPRQPVAGSSGECPFCAGNERLTPPELLAYRDSATGRDQPGWTVRVVPNRFPAFGLGRRQRRNRAGLYDSFEALGAHEVMIESPEHVTELVDLSAGRFLEIARAYRDRTETLRRDPRSRYVLIYKNQGASAGATLEHVHSQIVGMSRLPATAREELAGARVFYLRRGDCIYCEIIRAEGLDGARLVAESHNFVVLCPYASRFAYETWILPKAHAARYENASAPELEEFASLLRQTLSRLDRCLERPPFNYVLHSGYRDAAYYHWHLEILPRVQQVAGFEWGSGWFINTKPPEDAARELRNAFR
ncbi:MAG TPA: DUF4931 domain-containing protein [Candidatus Eisenbacteria bacterium]|nr:DUF4931 domain-containing protein [Candidatus Eisenbacteria bacterium]